MPKLNKNVQNVRDGWQNMPEKNRKIITGIAAATAMIIVIAVLVLFLGMDTSSSVLFTGLSQDEATEITGLLQDEDIMRLKQNIGKFVEQNPQMVAKLVQVSVGAQNLAQGEPGAGAERIDWKFPFEIELKLSETCT